MKKLITTSIILFTLILTSCEKEQPTKPKPNTTTSTTTQPTTQTPVPTEMCFDCVFSFYIKKTDSHNGTSYTQLDHTVKITNCAKDYPEQDEWEYNKENEYETDKTWSEVSSYCPLRINN